MPVIKVNTEGVQGLSNSIKTVKYRTEDCNAKVRMVKANLDWKVKARSNVSNRISKIQRRISSQEEKLDAFIRVVERTADGFGDKDRRLSEETKELVYKLNVCRAVHMLRNNEYERSAKGFWFLNEVGFINSMFAIAPVLAPLDIIKACSNYNLIKSGYSEDDSLSLFAKFLNNDLKTEGNVIHGEKSGETEWNGIDIGGKVSGDILHGEAKVKSSASFKWKDEDGNWNYDEFGLKTEASASGAIAKGEAEGNIGYLKGKVSGEVGTAKVSGNVKATLWDDGEFNPSLSIGAEAEVSALEGEAEVGFGTDDFGVGAAAEGDVFHAEAEAKAGIGYLGEDEDGNAKYGVAVEANAMASVAEGKVEGGVTVFGIDIDVGLKGYAGAAGVETGGSITTDGVKASFGGSLGIGAGIEVSIDWDDADWIGETVDTIGDVANSVGDFFVSGFKGVIGWF